MAHWLWLKIYKVKQASDMSQMIWDSLKKDELHIYAKNRFEESDSEVNGPLGEKILAQGPTYSWLQIRELDCLSKNNYWTTTAWKPNSFAHIENVNFIRK